MRDWWFDYAAGRAEPVIVNVTPAVTCTTIPVPVDRTPHDRRIAALEAKCMALERRVIELGDRLERALAELVHPV